MTWHPTTNLIQTDLLTREQRLKLEAWPHGVECYHGAGVWIELHSAWWPERVYRGKPATVVTSMWVNVYSDATLGPYETREMADLSDLFDRIDVQRIDTCNGVSTAHLEGLKDE